MIRRIALVSVHASPLTKLGSDKAGGMNVYVREVARELGRQGIEVDVYTAGLNGQEGIDLSLNKGVRVVYIPVDLNRYVGLGTAWNRGWVSVFAVCGVFGTVESGGGWFRGFTPHKNR